MDKEVINKRISYMKDRLVDIKEGLIEYNNLGGKNTKTIKAALERWTEEVIESAVTINNRILKEKGKVPYSYYDSFVQISEYFDFDEDFISKIADTAGFRNRLAHDYINLDNKITIKSIENLILIYKEYMIKVLEYLEK